MFPYKKKLKNFFKKVSKHVSKLTHFVYFLVSQSQSKALHKKNKGNMLTFPLKTNFTKKTYLKSFKAKIASKLTISLSEKIPKDLQEKINK
jgi:hypothetical protein